MLYGTQSLKQPKTTQIIQVVPHLIFQLRKTWILRGAANSNCCHYGIYHIPLSSKWILVFGTVEGEEMDCDQISATNFSSQEGVSLDAACAQSVF